MKYKRTGRRDGGGGWRGGRARNANPIRDRLLLSATILRRNELGTRAGAFAEGALDRTAGVTSELEHVVRG